MHTYTDRRCHLLAALRKLLNGGNGYTAIGCINADTDTELTLKTFR